ncbi:MAG: HEPN domain-containing protein [Bacteroidetes bacterium]|nr:HEPN domain-containing protein [Bacteroidota bacterium]
MLRSKRYLYVGFMCHQSIEKILKAYFSFIFWEIPPFTHNLAFFSKENQPRRFVVRWSAIFN